MQTIQGTPTDPPTVHPHEGSADYTDLLELSGVLSKGRHGVNPMSHLENCIKNHVYTVGFYYS